MKSNKTRQHLWQYEIKQNNSFDNMKSNKTGGETRCFVTMIYSVTWYAVLEK